MRIKTVNKINGVDIIFSEDSRYVAIKPISEALGISGKTQYDKIKRHPILGLLAKLVKASGRDGKRYKMFCLPIDHILIWLLSIDFRRVKSVSLKAVLVTQMELYYTIYREIPLSAQINKKITVDTIRLREMADFEKELRKAERKRKEAKLRMFD